MDKLARQLRDDAERIECAVSPQLDDRIRASLEGVQPAQAGRRAPTARPLTFWWASSLTGIAAAIAVIVTLNLRDPVAVQGVTEPAPQGLVIPSIEWQAETAVLTSPLEQEIEDLQTDLKKAEESVRQDIERLF